MSGMQVVPDRHNQSYFRADVPPAIRVTQGEPFTLKARSLLSRCNSSLPRAYEEMVLPLTGPVAVDGVKQGDILRIDILNIEIADRGAVITLPGYGAFDPPLEYSAQVLTIRDSLVDFDGIQLPVKPMVGKIGVAVPSRPPASNTVGSHGGNMDIQELTSGSSVLLPALVDEALLYAGDLHARQGDGESCLTGVEVAGSVTLSCYVANGFSVQRPVVLADEGKIMTIGDGNNLDKAVQVALDDMVTLLRQVHSWSREQAATFISIAGDVGVCQIVNPRVSAKVAVPANTFRFPEH